MRAQVTDQTRRTFLKRAALGAASAAATPNVTICFVNHSGDCNSRAGWQVEDGAAGLDSCAGTQMFSANLGYDEDMAQPAIDD